MTETTLKNIHSAIAPSVKSPEENFWNISAEKYLIKQKNQDYQLHFKAINEQLNNLSSNAEIIIFNLASGKITPIIEFLLKTSSDIPIYLINIDLSEKITKYNNTGLKKQDFIVTTKNNTKWWVKKQLYVKNWYGNIQAIIDNPDLYSTLNALLICFDGFSNLPIPNDMALKRIIAFMTKFNFSYSTWLYPGDDFRFFTEKLHFYYNVVRNTQLIPLNSLTIRYFMEEGKLDVMTLPFELSSITSIEKRIIEFNQQKLLSAIGVTIEDDPTRPNLRFHAIYCQPSVLQNLFQNSGVKCDIHDSFSLNNKPNSFVKTYPIKTYK